MDWIQRNFRTLIYISFLVPILLVAFVSISHVTTWYGLSNPLTWAIYLSVGIEIAALSALAAISASMGRKVYVPFGVVTLIQFIGNIFFAYQYIDVNSEQFKDWVELVDPVVSYLGVESGNIISHKRFLSLFSGGMLPIISLSFLHMLVKFEEEEKSKKADVVPDIDIEKLSIEAGRMEAEYDEQKINPTDEDLKKWEEYLMELNEKKFGVLEDKEVPVQPEEPIIEPQVEPEPVVEVIVEPQLEEVPVVAEQPIEDLSIEVQISQPEEATETIEVEPDFYTEETPDYNLGEEQPNNPKVLRYFSSH
jgi:hypothetical protein